MVKFKKKLVAGLITAGLSMPMVAMATNGYFSNGYGIKSKGMAGTGVALPNDAIAAATNPAGMVMVGNRVDFGLDVFKPDREAQVGGTWYSANDEDQFYIPEFGYNQMINGTMSWGVSVYGNGGMNTNFNAGVYSSSMNGIETGANLAQLFIAPTFSMKINEKNTFGVSLNLIYQTFEATGLGNFCGFTSGGCSSTPYQGLTDQGEDSSTGYSIKLGWIGQITDQLKLGASYQTESEMSKFDKYNELFANGGEFNIPSTWTIGLAFDATPKFTVAFDVQKINYSDIPALANPNNGYTGGILGTANGPGFGWQDMTIYKLGVEYHMDDLVLRAGYSQGDQPIPAGETAFNAIAPAVVEESITFGATWTLQNKSELSAYYMYVPEVTVYGDSPGNTNDAGHGDLRMSQTAFGVAYGWKF